MLRILHLYKESFRNIQPTIWILTLVTFINRIGSMVLLYTSLYLTNDLHFEISTAGVCMSFYGIGSIIGSYTGGWLTDRSNPAGIMIFSLMGSAFILLFLLITKTTAGVAIVIFLYSFTADMFRPAIAKATAEYSSLENRTRSVSLIRLAINLGFSAGTFIGGLLVVYAGYKWLFIMDASTSFSAAVMLIFSLPQKNGKEATSQKIKPQQKTSAYRDKQYLFFILMVTFYGICFFQLFASIPQYLNKQCFYNEDAIGLLMGLNGLLVVLIEIPLVTFLEKKRRNLFRYILIGATCVPVAFLILELSKGNWAMTLAYIVVITFSEIFCMPFMMNYSLSKPMKERQGQYSALYSIAYGAANSIAPVVGLGIADAFGFSKMFLFFIFIGLLTIAGFWYLHKTALPSSRDA